MTQHIGKIPRSSDNDVTHVFDMRVLTAPAGSLHHCLM